MEALSSTLLELKNLSVSAGGKRLLAGFNCSLSAGELTVIAGPSGCGKTTLLRAIAGLIDPDCGEILFNGGSPEKVGWPGYRRRVVMVGQRPVLFDASVRDNLSRPFSYRSSDLSFPEERAKDLLDRFLLSEDHLEQNARSLSVGQKQRICLVRALLIDPAVLLLDEPISALDEDSAGAVESLIREEASEKGLAALIVAHDSGMAERLGSGLLKLDDFPAGTLE